MIYRRTIGIYCFIALMMTILIYRIYYINAADYLTMAAAGQGSYSLPIATTRGMIYDREMKPLVNNSYEYIASVLPSPQSAAAILPILSEEIRPAIVEKFSETMPFAMSLPNNDVFAKGVDIFRIPKRYGGYSYAPHLIGYLSGDGVSGVAGIELAYDKELKEAGGKISCLYKVDAAGHVMTGAAMNVSRENETPLAGVSLTLDKDIQQVAQDALLVGCDKGAAVVVDVKTGEILAMASIPAFDQNNIAASLDSTDSPFISRAISGYNIGSVFKVLTSSAALEKGISASREHDCVGYIDVGGVVFHCNNKAVHGVCDMKRALQVSCNAYFISLAEELGDEYLLSFCKNFGLGKSVDLGGGIKTQAGNLPTLAELKNPAALANFGFGQGSSLASPLQIATVLATVANGGTSVTPQVVRGYSEDGTTLITEPESFAANRIISEKSAETMRKLLIDVVETGSGRTAKPITGSAGGKTSSAQTGQIKDGKELVHAWFAGFYPAVEPKYSIAIFVENGESGEHVAAPIFKKIADGIAKLKKN